jgi:hypothetical protein
MNSMARYTMFKKPFQKCLPQDLLELYHFEYSIPYYGNGFKNKELLNSI